MAAGKMCSRKGKAETAEVCSISVINHNFILSLNIFTFLFWASLFVCGRPRPVALPVYRGKLRHRVSTCVIASVMSAVDRAVPQRAEDRAGLPRVCQEDDGGGRLLHHLPQGDFPRGGLQVKISGRWNTAAASCSYGELMFHVTQIFFYFTRPVYQSSAWRQQHFRRK